MAGVLLYVINFFLWIAVLSKVDLSVAFPTGSIQYIFILLASSLFLGEHINRDRIFGTIFIIAGIVFVALK
ncbi:MAG: EamA family transporter [Pseudomonadota bacterium]